LKETSSNRTSPRGAHSARAVSFSGTELRSSRIRKKSSSAGSLKNSEETNDAAVSRRPISSIAKPMKLTISPTLAMPCMCSQVPTTTIAITASVLDARVITLTSAHQFSTGN
jgi:hypothetical protein